MHLGADSFRGSSVKIGTIQRSFAWPLREDDTRKSRSVNKCLYVCLKTIAIITLDYDVPRRGEPARLRRGEEEHALPQEARTHVYAYMYMYMCIYMYIYIYIYT